MKGANYIMDELIKPFYSETKTPSIKVEEIKPTISKPAKDESQEHKKSDFGFDFSFFTDPDKAVISINNTNHPNIGFRFNSYPFRHFKHLF